MDWRVRLCLGPGFGGNGRLFRHSPSRVLVAQHGQAWIEDARGRRVVADFLSAFQEELRRGNGWAVGFFSYEWGEHFGVQVPTGQRLLPLAWWAFLTDDREEDRVGEFAATAPAVGSVSEQTYHFGVDAVRSKIGAGEVYQVNLTRRWQVKCRGDPAALFFRLADPELPRFALYLEDTFQGWSLLCLSPELFLRRQGEQIESWPIKGTWWGSRKGEEPQEKERAELAMIVDLVRNDLGRFCKVGSVEVIEPSRPVPAKDVTHREAVVRGLVPGGLRLSEILQATFPGGSVTGAPKLAACATIAQLETVPRGPYCGACGLFFGQDNFTLAMPIRTGYTVDGSLYFHSGAGVVWDSLPEREEEESRAKVASWFAALGRTC